MTYECMACGHFFEGGPTCMKCGTMADQDAIVGFEPDELPQVVDLGEYRKEAQSLPAD